MNYSFQSKYKAYSPTENQIKLGFKLIKHYEDSEQIVRIDMINNKDKWLVSEVERINPGDYAEKSISM